MSAFDHGVHVPSDAKGAGSQLEARWGRLPATPSAGIGRERHLGAIASFDSPGGIFWSCNALQIFIVTAGTLL